MNTNIIAVYHRGTIQTRETDGTVADYCPSSPGVGAVGGPIVYDHGTIQTRETDGTTAQAAQELGPEDRTRRLCHNGEIEGAWRHGNSWLIPSPIKRLHPDASWPAGHITLTQAAPGVGQGPEARMAAVQTGADRGRSDGGQPVGHPKPPHRTAAQGEDLEEDGRGFRHGCLLRTDVRPGLLGEQELGRLRAYMQAIVHTGTIADEWTPTVTDDCQESWGDRRTHPTLVPHMTRRGYRPHGNLVRHVLPAPSARSHRTGRPFAYHSNQVGGGQSLWAAQSTLEADVYGAGCPTPRPRQRWCGQPCIDQYLLAIGSMLPPQGARVCDLRLRFRRIDPNGARPSAGHHGCPGGRALGTPHHLGHMGQLPPAERRRDGARQGLCRRLLALQPSMALPTLPSA